MLMKSIKYLIIIISFLNNDSHIICAEINRGNGIITKATHPAVLVLGNINQISTRDTTTAAMSTGLAPIATAAASTATATTTSGQYYLFDNNADNTIVGTMPLIIQPYNIFDSIILCPVGYILAHNHCHKQVKSVKYFRNV
ncbi:hypothetical protein FF38_01669 [Lucilia cuprina]|uniref:Uncharacterized protein n=1 Tax=Lucilia cuprina TaxID=7375 RepID=A0A0L0BRN8_LUCCU|nr:hypothetical protein FF38_01669 [Lucilia cuprina]